MASLYATFAFILSGIPISKSKTLLYTHKEMPMQEAAQLQNSLHFRISSCDLLRVMSQILPGNF